MVDGNNVSGLGMVAVAVVSTGIIMASYYHFHRRLESNLKLNKTIIDATTGADQRRQSSAKTTKKVRFADQVTTDLSSDGDELRRATATAGAGGKLVRPALRKAACSSTRLAH